ncbi:MAG: hypothetical protein QW228_08120 [Candidatus Aenigmatarchaeota archaeon]
MKKCFLPIILVIFISGCIEAALISSKCRVDKEVGRCEISKDGTASLSGLDLPSSAVLTSAKISPCEITGKLWSCREMDFWKVKDCEIISSSQPFKVKCPIEKGAWMVKFNILKPKACPDPVDPSVLRDCEEVVRVYQEI